MTYVTAEMSQLMGSSSLDSNMDEIKFRAATLPDLKRIIVISNHFNGGAVFTRLMFTKWLADEHWLLFVAEEASGDVIGFAALNVRHSEPRVTVWSLEGLESKQQPSVFCSLARYSLLACQQRFPTTKSAVGLFSADEIPLLKSLSVRETFDSLTVRWCLDPNTSCFQDVYVANMRFCSLYEGEESVRSLFPSNNIVAGFAVYDASLLESRVFLDDQADIIFLFTSASTSSKLALSVISLLPPSVDMPGSLMATANFYGTDIKMMKHQVSTVMNMVSKVGMELGKNELVLRIGIHGYQGVRNELVEFMTERKRLKLLHQSVLMLTEFGMSKSFGVNEPHNLSESDKTLIAHESVAVDVQTLSKL